MVGCVVLMCIVLYDWLFVCIALYRFVLFAIAVYCVLCVVTCYCLSLPFDCVVLFVIAVDWCVLMLIPCYCCWSSRIAVYCCVVVVGAWCCLCIVCMDVSTFVLLCHCVLLCVDF